MQLELRFKSMAADSITELSRRTGLASSALRFYERKDLLRPIGRAHGKRVYTDGAVEQVALIDLLQLAGFSLTEIAAFIDPHGRAAPDWRHQVRKKLTELDERIEKIRRAKAIVQHTVECPHERLDECPVHQSAVRFHATTLLTREARPRGMDTRKSLNLA